MKCPICTTELVITGQARLETLDEHVCDPNGKISLKDKYQCPNKECDANKKDVCWNWHGDLYTEDFHYKFAFISNNNAPFGSWQRRQNIEIYKHDEDYNFLSFKIGKNKFIVKRIFNYKSNDDGDILSRKGRFQILINGTYYISGIHMFIFCIKDFYRKKKYGMKYQLSNWDKRWWKISTDWIFKTFYPNNISNL